MSKWDLVELSEIGDIITGNTPKTSESAYYESNDIPFLKPSDFSSDNIDLIKTEFYISEKARVKARIIPTGSVVVTCIGIIGKTKILRSECAFNQQINAVIPKDNNYNRYIAYAIFFQKELLQIQANSAVVPIINKTEFSKIKIPLPPLEIQHQIASTLDKVTRTIDLCNQIIEKLDLLVKARFVEMFGDLMYNPYNWEVFRISDISTYLKSGLSRKLSDDDIGIPCIRSGNIQNGRFIFSDIKYWYINDPQGANTTEYVLTDGDILVNFINSASQIGKTCIFKDVGRDCIYTTNIFRMKLNNKCNKNYYNWYAMTEYYYRQLQNIIQPAVNQASFTTVNFLKLKIPIPPIELQNQFSDFVEQIDNSKLAVKQVLEKAETLKKALMQEYFG